MVAKRFLLILFGCIVLNCASTKPEFKSSKFTFQFTGTYYQIVSINSPTGDGINILRSDTSSTNKIHARDINQDGVLDIVIKGELSLSELNTIYIFGINQASESGNLQEKHNQHVFEHQTPTYHYQIKGFYLEDYQYNLFTISDLTNSTSTTYMDMLADGILELDEFEPEISIVIQNFYELVLNEGIAQKKIQFKNGIYKVEARSEPFLASH